MIDNSMEDDYSQCGHKSFCGWPKHNLSCILVGQSFLRMKLILLKKNRHSWLQKNHTDLSRVKMSHMYAQIFFRMNIPLPCGSEFCSHILILSKVHGQIKKTKQTCFCVTLRNWVCCRANVHSISGECWVFLRSTNTCTVFAILNTRTSSQATIQNISA